MSDKKICRGYWSLVKVSFLLTLIILTIVALWLAVGGKPLTRRAAAGLVVMPPLIIYYIRRFPAIQCSTRSMLAHLGTVFCAGVVSFCIYVHKAAPPLLDAITFGQIAWTATIAVFGFAICIILVLQFDGYGRNQTLRSSRRVRRRGEPQRDETPVRKALQQSPADDKLKAAPEE